GLTTRGGRGRDRLPVLVVTPVTGVGGLACREGDNPLAWARQRAREGRVRSLPDLPRTRLDAGDLPRAAGRAHGRRLARVEHSVVVVVDEENEAAERAFTRIVHSVSIDVLELRPGALGELAGLEHVDHCRVADLR